MTTVLVRSATEVASRRAQAQERLSSSDYMRRRAQAVLDTFDWVDGTAPAPVSQEPGRVADAEGLALEERHAVSDETLARRTGQDGLYPGVVGHTVAWLLDPRTESPIW